MEIIQKYRIEIIIFAKKVEKSGSTFVLISTRQIYEPKMNIKENLKN